MDNWSFVVAAGLLTVGVGLIVWQFRRSRKLVHDWAGRSGLRVLCCRRRFFRRGPFFWWTGRGQEVFRVLVEDSEGARRWGYVRVGGFLLGMLSDRVQVRWDGVQRKRAVGTQGLPL